jgi:ankyrin repeat protein
MDIALLFVSSNIMPIDPNQGENMLITLSKVKNWTSKHLQLAKALIKHNGLSVNSVDVSGATALFYASDKLDLLQLLLGSHAVNVNIRDRLGRNALHSAIYGNYTGAIAQLIKAGINVNNCDEYGYTPLMCACSLSYETTAAMKLIEAGAQVNASAMRADGRVMTALTIAIDCNAFKAAKLLIENHASIDLIIDSNGSTLFDIVTVASNDPLVNTDKFEEYIELIKQVTQLKQRQNWEYTQLIDSDEETEMSDDAVLQLNEYLTERNLDSETMEVIQYTFRDAETVESMDESVSFDVIHESVFKDKLRLVNERRALKLMLRTAEMNNKIAALNECKLAQQLPNDLIKMIADPLLW